MKVLVPIKHVAAFAADHTPAGSGRIDRADLDWSINEWDEFSVEAALQLRDAADDGEVVVVTVGHEETVEGLVSSLARGADRAIRVWDRSLSDADPIRVARVLAAVIRREQPDLVLCGAKSSDGGHGATGVATAALAGLPHVAVVSELRLEAHASLAVTRELDEGLRERLRVRLPALLTLQTGVNEPRYVALRAMAEARGRPIEALGLADVDLDEAGPPAHVVRRLATPRRMRAEMLPSAPDQAAAAILRIVAQKTRTPVAEPA